MLGTSFIEFKLDYSATKNLPIGEKIIAADSILAGGRSWRICCYPRGVCEELSNNGEYLCLCAATRSRSRHGVKAVFQAFPMGRDGAPLLSHAKWSTDFVDYSNGVTVIAFHKFMKRSELESGCYLVNGCVKFVCGFIDIVGSDGRVPVPPTDLGDHLGNLLEGTDGSDVSFSVGGETFCAHRAILAARSPVFKAQLLGSMADAKMDHITLHNVQPEVFRILLRFIYTDALPSDTELVKDLEGSSATDLLQHLLAVADMYQLDRLKLVCAQKLWDRVSPETVADMLGCAEAHYCPELKKRCIDFFMVDKNFKSAVLTEGYLRLMQGFPSVMDEIKARVVQP